MRALKSLRKRFFGMVTHQVVYLLQREAHTNVHRVGRIVAGPNRRVIPLKQLLHQSVLVGCDYKQTTQEKQIDKSHQSYFSKFRNGKEILWHSTSKDIELVEEIVNIKAETWILPRSSVCQVTY